MSIDVVNKFNNGNGVCPRCGDDLRASEAYYGEGSESKYIRIKVCPRCIIDEAIRELCGNPISLEDWAYYPNRVSYV